MSKIATGIAAEIDLAPGTARRVLLAHVRTLQNGQNPAGGVMNIAILIAAAGVILTSVKWAFLPFIPWRRLPRHRVRYLRIRLRLRLHPGAGPRHRRRTVAAVGTAGHAYPQRAVPAPGLTPRRPGPRAGQRATRS